MNEELRICYIVTKKNIYEHYKKEYYTLYTGFCVTGNLR